VTTAGREGYSSAGDEKHARLFRLHKNALSRRIRYESIHTGWIQYCEQVGIDCTMHQVRHAYATKLVNDAVSLATIRKRRGHQDLKTMLRYAGLHDTEADEEIRLWCSQQEAS